MWPVIPTPPYPMWKSNTPQGRGFIPHIVAFYSILLTLVTIVLLKWQRLLTPESVPPATSGPDLDQLHHEVQSSTVVSDHGHISGFARRGDQKNLVEVTATSTWTLGNTSGMGPPDNWTLPRSKTELNFAICLLQWPKMIYLLPMVVASLLVIFYLTVQSMGAEAVNLDTCGVESGQKPDSAVSQSHPGEQTGLVPK